MGEDEGVFYYAYLSAACWENEDGMKNYMFGHKALRTGATCITYELPVRILDLFKQVLDFILNGKYWTRSSRKTPSRVSRSHHHC